jgi:hypothetical protein
MKRLRTALVLLAILAMLAVLVSVQLARDRAHQSIGRGTIRRIP